MERKMDGLNVDSGVSITLRKSGDGSTDTNKHWNKREKRMWILTLFLGCSMVYAARTVMPLCIVSIADEMMWNKKDSGMVLSAFFWGYAMTQVLGGYLSDKIGGATVLVTAAVGWSLLTFWTPWLVYMAPSRDMALYIVVASRVFMGAFQGVHYPSLTNVLSQKVSKIQRAFSFSATTSGSHMGTLFCGSVGSVLMERFGWHTPFYVIGFLGMSWLLFLRYYLMSWERRKQALLAIQEVPGITPEKEKIKVPWMELFKTVSFWAILVGHFCMNNAFFVLLSWLPTYFHENFPHAKGWVFNVVPWLVTIPSSVSAGFFADKLIANGYDTGFVRKLCSTIALCGCGIFLLCIAYTKTYESALFFMAMAIASTGFHAAGILVNPQDVAPKYAGSVFGLMNMAGAVPGFVGVYIAGYILEVTGSWTAVFNQTAVVCFVGWLVFLIFGTGKQIVS